MPLLCLHSCANACEVMLRVDGKDHHRQLPMQSGHDRVLAELVQQCLQDADISMNNISCIAVVTGPGSFTGSRIGVAFARALALVLEVPAIGLNWLHIKARNNRQASHSRSSNYGFAVDNVGRDQMAWCVLKDEEVLCAPRAGSLQEMNDSLGQFGLCAPQDSSQQNPASMSDMADLAQLVVPAMHPAEPWYARPPDAKLPKSKQTGKKGSRSIDPWA